MRRRRSVVCTIPHRQWRRAEKAHRARRPAAAANGGYRRCRCRRYCRRVPSLCGISSLLILSPTVRYGAMPRHDVPPGTRAHLLAVRLLILQLLLLLLRLFYSMHVYNMCTRVYCSCVLAKDARATMLLVPTCQHYVNILYYYMYTRPSVLTLSSTRISCADSGSSGWRWCCWE